MDIYATVNSSLLTPNEAADYLRLAPATLAGWRCDPKRAPGGHGPQYVRIGTGRRATVRYRLVDLERWVNAQVVA